MRQNTFFSIFEGQFTKFSIEMQTIENYDFSGKKPLSVLTSMCRLMKIS